MATKPKPSVKKKTTSVRVTKKKRGISKLQGLAVAAVLALVGVVVVVASHASGTPNYQYSYSKYCVADRGTSSEVDVQKCKNTSAEAMVYRLYKGLLNRDPSASEYQYWTQQFAGDRTKIAESSLVQKLVATHPDDNQFIVKLYVAMLKRSATTKEVTSWTNRLKATGAKQWSREKVAYQFAISSEAIRKNQDGLNTFLALPTTPKVAVVQNAANAQHDRFDKMLTDYARPTLQDAKTAAAAAVSVQTQLNAAKTVASKSAPTLTDLTTIANYEKTAQQSQDAAAKAAREASSKAKSAASMYARAKELALYATDISDNSVYGLNKIKARYDDVLANAKEASSKAQSIQMLVGGISEQYGVAEKKYEAEKKRRAAAAATTPAGSGTTSGSGSTSTPGGTGGGTGTTGGAGGSFLSSVFGGNVPSTNCAAKSFSIKAGFMNYKNYTLKNSFFSNSKCIIGSTSNSTSAKYRVVTLPSL